MKFVAHRREKDGDYSETIIASSWEEAEKVARSRRWVLDGKLYLSVPAIGPNWIPDVIISLLWFGESVVNIARRLTTACSRPPIMRRLALWLKTIINLGRGG